MDTSNTGLWMIFFDSARQTKKMFCNATMLRLLGLSDHPDPETCYCHWYERIDKNHIYRVENAVTRIIETGRQHEVQYPWLHPDLGFLFVRCGGKVMSSEDGCVCICGYHQDVTEMERVKKELEGSLRQLSKTRHHTDEIERLKAHYQHLAYVDMLTALPNRRAFFEMSENFINHRDADCRNDWVMISDVDHFKNINDTYGHFSGDEVLRELARRFQENLRENTEFIGRIGGEEFAIFILDACEADACKLAEKLRRICSDEPYVLKSGERIFLTCSFGVAGIDAPQGRSTEEILSRAMRSADAALYQAKNDGRDRVVFYREP